MPKTAAAQSFTAPTMNEIALEDASFVIFVLTPDSSAVNFKAVKTLGPGFAAALKEWRASRLKYAVLSAPCLGEHFSGLPRVDLADDIGALCDALNALSGECAETGAAFFICDETPLGDALRAGTEASGRSIN
jgi:hypothetical protein